MCRYKLGLFFFILVFVGCSNPSIVDRKAEKEELISMYQDYRNSIEAFNYNEADELYAEINEKLKDDIFKKDREILRGYLNSLHKLEEKGTEPYQEFLKDLPKDYNGILSDVFWGDHNKL